jgi:hypothetical protein
MTVPARSMAMKCQDGRRVGQGRKGFFLKKEANTFANGRARCGNAHAN